MKPAINLLVTLTLLLVISNVTYAATFSDDFEDGVIDSTLWVVDGAKRGCGPPCGSNTGDWNYTYQEITDPRDGYLELNVWGPASGNTYGAEAWVRTSHDFNDDSNYTINFTWEPDIDESHYNYYFIQITDGYISSENNLHWNLESYPGTCNLLRDPDTGDIGWSIGTSPGKLNWSIKIESSGVASLYDGPNATGRLKYECSLDSADEWYIRFMVSDGTSSGFSAGDAWLNLYDFSTEYTSITTSTIVRPPTTTIVRPSTTTIVRPSTTTIVRPSTTTIVRPSTTTTSAKSICSSSKIYGDDSNEAELLRYIRDNILSKTPEGRELIKLYYQWSPAIVKAMEKDEEFKEEIKEMIDGVLGLVTETE